MHRRRSARHPGGRTCRSGFHRRSRSTLADGEAMVDGRPTGTRPTPARSPARRVGSSGNRPRVGERDVARRGGRGTDRRRARCRSTTRRGRRRRGRAAAPPIASSASGYGAGRARRSRSRSPPRPHFDGSSTVSASAAATTASKALPPSRIAAAPAWAASGAAAETTPLAPAAGALLGHHRTARGARRRRATRWTRLTSAVRARRSDADGTSEKWVCTPTTARRGDVASQHDRRPARSGEAMPSASVPMESHGTTATAWQPSAEAITTSSSTPEREPVDRRPDVAPLLASRSSSPWTTSAYVPKATTSGEKRRRGRGHVGGGDLGAPRSDPLRTTDSIDFDRREGLASSGSESIQYTHAERRCVARDVAATPAPGPGER